MSIIPSPLIRTLSDNRLIETAQDVSRTSHQESSAENEHSAIYSTKLLPLPCQHGAPPSVRVIPFDFNENVRISGDCSCSHRNLAETVWFIYHVFSLNSYAASEGSGNCARRKNCKNCLRIAGATSAEARTTQLDLSRSMLIPAILPGRSGMNK